MFFLWCFVSGPRLEWGSYRVGFNLGPQRLFSAGGGRGSLVAWYTTALDIEEVLSGVVDSDIDLFVADVMKSFDTVDRDILGMLSSTLGLLDWLRHAYVEYHSHVRSRFQLASGFGELCGLVMGAFSRVAH